MFDVVVIGIDGYEAGRDAISLAKALLSGDGEVTLVYVEVLQSKPAPEADTRPDDEAQRFGLERLGRLRDEGQIAADISRVEAPSVRRGLHEFAAGQDADLLVIGAGRHDPVAHMFLGDEAREVLEDPPCPVAVAPAGYSKRPGQIRKIGVAYDGSPESHGALALARKLTVEHHASLSAFEAVPAPAYARDVWNLEGEIDADVEKARQRIAALGDVEAHAEFADDAVDGLRRYGASVDLLVVGAHRHRPADRLVERSTSQRLADEPSCPLLVLGAAERDGADG
ncbi:MAG: universal stress protein [Solirubrobacterales bacterium]|nr:universal stress protein [Solirubrobacterales bacterium]